MVEHLLTHAGFFGVAGVIRHSRRKRRYVWRRIRRAHAENIRHDPLAARHRRSPFGLGRRDQERSLTSKSLANIHIVAKGYPSELASVDVFDSVVLCEALVNKSVISGQELRYRTVFTNHGIEQQLDFTPHCLA